MTLWHLSLAKRSGKKSPVGTLHKTRRQSNCPYENKKKFTKTGNTAGTVPLFFGTFLRNIHPASPHTPAHASNARTLTNGSHHVQRPRRHRPRRQARRPLRPGARRPQGLRPHDQRSRRAQEGPKARQVPHRDLPGAYTRPKRHPLVTRSASIGHRTVDASASFAVVSHHDRSAPRSYTRGTEIAFGPNRKARRYLSAPREPPSSVPSAFVTVSDRRSRGLPMNPPVLKPKTKSLETKN